MSDRILGSTTSDCCHSIEWWRTILKIDVTLIGLHDPNPPLPCTSRRWVFVRPIFLKFVLSSLDEFYLKAEQPQSVNEFVGVVIDIDIESNSHWSLCHATHIHAHRTPNSILEYLVRICVAFINMTFFPLSLITLYAFKFDSRTASKGIKINYQKIELYPIFDLLIKWLDLFPVDLLVSGNIQFWRFFTYPIFTVTLFILRLGLNQNETLIDFIKLMVIFGSKCLNCSSNQLWFLNRRNSTPLDNFSSSSLFALKFFIRNYIYWHNYYYICCIFVVYLRLFFVFLLLLLLLLLLNLSFEVFVLFSG